MKRSLNLAVLGIDHGHIFDMLDEMIKEGCNCNHFWTDGSPLTLKEFNKKYPNIKRLENKSDIFEKFPSAMSSIRGRLQRAARFRCYFRSEAPISSKNTDLFTSQI